MTSGGNLPRLESLAASARPASLVTALSPALTSTGAPRSTSTVAATTQHSVRALAEQIEQMQDILLDGTNYAGVECDALSIGIGFNAKRIANPTTVLADPPPPIDPCTVTLDGGADSGDQ
jgi:hypothetical protein